VTDADVARFWSFVRKSAGCWEWTGGTIGLGYGGFWLSGRQVRAHRLSFQMHGGYIPAGQFVLHRCDNPPCVRPDHLYAGDHATNMRDRMERGRTARGDRMPHPRVHGSAHPRAKLTEADVAVIRAEYRPGRGGDLMRRYGVSQASLWAVVHGKSWKHVA
jgi:hypothetical protein